MTRIRSHSPAAVAVVASAAVLAAASPALAAASPAARMHSCTPAAPSFTSLIASATVSCSEARSLNRYMTTHETLSGAFRLHGQTWRGTVCSRAGNRTAMVYRHGRQTVRLTFGAAAS